MIFRLLTTINFTDKNTSCSYTLCKFYIKREMFFKQALKQNQNKSNFWIIKARKHMAVTKFSFIPKIFKRKKYFFFGNVEMKIEMPSRRYFSVNFFD